jgi:purine-binding chemotaxis protein CheW
MTTAEASAGVGRVCTFRVGDVWLGVDVLAVREVLLHEQLTPIPLAPHAISGLLNLRGDIVAAIDVRRRLWPDAKTPAGPSADVFVVLDIDGYDRVGLLVDDIGDVLDVSDLPLEPLSDTAVGVLSQLALGAYQTPSALLLLLDVAALVDVSDADVVITEDPQPDVRG